MSSIPTDSRISASSIPSALRCSERHRGVRHERRVLDQALHAAEAFGEREERQRSSTRRASSSPPFSTEGHDAAEAVRSSAASPARAADGSAGPDR